MTGRTGATGLCAGVDLVCPGDQRDATRAGLPAGHVAQAFSVVVYERDKHLHAAVAALRGVNQDLSFVAAVVAYLPSLAGEVTPGSVAVSCQSSTDVAPSRMRDGREVGGWCGGGHG
jgi:hypothetical protein